MLLFNEVIKLPLSSQGSVCLFIAGVIRACLENVASIRSRLRLQTPGREEVKGLSHHIHISQTPLESNLTASWGMTLTRAKCLARGRNGLHDLRLARVMCPSCSKSNLLKHVTRTLHAHFLVCLRDNNLLLLGFGGPALQVLGMYVGVIGE